MIRQTARRRKRDFGRVLGVESLEQRRCLSAIGFAEHLIVDPIGAGSDSILADLDNDGDDDLVAYGKWRENVDGQLGPTHAYATQAIRVFRPLAAADLDDDGDLDLVVSASVNDVAQTAWFENRDGRGSFGPMQTISLGDIRSAAVGDIDDDRDVDIVLHRTYLNGAGDIIGDINVLAKSRARYFRGGPADFVVSVYHKNRTRRRGQRR